jgi:unsaturated chondroitin disaccharide hydrolase
MTRFHFFAIVISSLVCSTLAAADSPLDVDRQLNYCLSQASRTVAEINPDGQMPRAIEAGSSQWLRVPIDDWTSGFWPGILWSCYEYTGALQWKTAARRFTRTLDPVTRRRARDHDLGFMVFSSYGAGYRLTRSPEYKDAILRSADALSGLFNPKVGTILSWPWAVGQRNWPHNTIIDNMMNLELLFWASKNGGAKSHGQIAIRHADTTMRNHLRPDFSSYHVIVYDDKTGQKIKGVTEQGCADESMWARGQAWGIYGFTMSYRETRKTEYLETAQQMADIFIKRLPTDMIPYWDFDAPGAPSEPRDSSAAAIAASAFLELSVLAPDAATAAKYRETAEKILTELSSDRYLAGQKSGAFLLHATGNKPANSEIDASLIYGDYYYLEALLRLKKLRAGQSIYENLKRR